MISTQEETLWLYSVHQVALMDKDNRIMCEEAALLNDELFNDVLSPIANVPRRSSSSGHNPEELNGQIHFLTTSYFKGSEYDRCLKMANNMAELTGDISIGAGWELACNLGRGESRTQILNKKENLSPLFFATNYESKWVGGSDNCLIDIRKLFPLRTLEHTELKGDGKSEYYIGCDVARSNKTNNNQTSICIAKVKRNKKNLVSKIQLVNMINLPAGLNFTAQAIELKRLKYLFDARMVVVDSNGLGQGLLEELLKEHIDPLTRKEYPAWNTTNTEDEPDTVDYDQCLFGLKAQGINNDIILNFISLFDNGGMVELLTKIDQNQFDSSGNYLDNDKIAHIQTDLFIEEISNLQLETLNGGKLGVKQSTKAIDKDRYSATAYCLYYLMKYENKTQEEINTDYTRLLQFRQPHYR